MKKQKTFRTALHSSTKTTEFVENFELIDGTMTKLFYVSSLRRELKLIFVFTEFDGQMYLDYNPISYSEAHESFT